jgi:hypothetical protein
MVVDGKGYIPRKARNFSLFHSVQPPIHWILGTLYPEENRPGRENDHFSPFSAEVKNGGATSPLLRHRGMVLNQLSSGTTLNFPLRNQVSPLH